MAIVNPGHSHDSPVQVGILVPAQVGIGRVFDEGVSTAVSSRTTVSYIEGGPYSETSLFSTVTNIPTGELEFVHPTGQWGAFDLDNGQL